MLTVKHEASLLNLVAAVWHGTQTLQLQSMLNIPMIHLAVSQDFVVLSAVALVVADVEHLKSLNCMMAWYMLGCKGMLQFLLLDQPHINQLLVIASACSPTGRPHHADNTACECVSMYNIYTLQTRDTALCAFMTCFR